MKFRSHRATIVLLLGDIILFIAALWVTLFLRYGEWPTSSLFDSHLQAFTAIWVAWIIVFFIFDLYRRPTSLFKKDLPQTIANAQIVNTILAIIFFYYVPIVGIAPRTNLFIYLLVSFIFILVWRRYFVHHLYRGRAEQIIFIGSGKEVSELKDELSTNTDYNLKVSQVAEPQTLTPGAMVVFNPDDPQVASGLTQIYRSMFSGSILLTLSDLYELVFRRVPVELINERWVINNVSTPRRGVYDLVKRLIDLAVALPLGLISLVIYPFIFIAIKLSDGGTMFYADHRVGRNGKEFVVYKFRSMSMEMDLSARHVTRLGKILRKTRLDELPQLWSVIMGEQSLIGPRPEKPDYAALYRRDIPYYDLRYLIAPGLSGWAQIYHDNHPHFAPAVDATKEKLSYDLYYIKHRSLWLDVSIGLKTIRTLLSTKGA